MVSSSSTMTHFNRFIDRRIVDELLMTCDRNSSASVSLLPNNSLKGGEHVIDCIEWNELSSGWKDTAPFPRCLVPRSNKHMFTEDNLEAVIAQKIINALNESSTGIEDGKNNGAITRRSFPNARSESLNRSRPANAVLPLKEARFQPCGDLLSSREAMLQSLTPQQKRLQREIQRDLRKREMEVENAKNADNAANSDSEVTSKPNGTSRTDVPVSDTHRVIPSVTPRLMMAGPQNINGELILPPIDIPLVSLSFNYDRLNEKMNWWDEEIRKDIQTKADARNRAKLETLMDSEEGTLGGDIFSIKSILHTCNYECDCNKYPERQNKLFETSVATAMIAANRDPASKLKSRFATNVALRRVSRGSAASQRRTSTSSGHVAWSPPATLPLSAVSSSTKNTSAAQDGSTADTGESKDTCDPSRTPASAGTDGGTAPGATSGVSGFCSNALGHPKVREAKSIPSIPTDCDVVSKAVTLTGKRLQVAIPR